MKNRLVPALLLSLSLFPSALHAFCGFYVAKADTALFNKASKVAIVRDGNRTVLTMANDFKGDPQEFAIVIPVPTFLEREQINVGDRAVLDHLDAYTAPRLVEYFDEDPCRRPDRVFEMQKMSAPTGAGVSEKRARAESLGVTIEAEYTVGEYDILILSARESDGLETWLRENGYKTPRGAAQVLGSYLKQGMRFFVAKVNLKEKSKLGFTYLRPLQVAFESPKFMLPIRLGTLNADGAQDLFVFVLNRSGRVETTNYRTVNLPSNLNVPELVEARFSDFYRDMFSREVKKDGMRAVYLEYAWDMGWCDPCAADPLTPQELQQLGVFWLEGGAARGLPPQQAQNVFVTRLHLRYTAETFPEDLVFQETGDRQNFQGRYVIQHPWKGSPNACPAARDYFADLRRRQDREAQTLARLTGWDLAEIQGQMQQIPQPATDERPWWKKLWGDG